MDNNRHNITEGNKLKVIFEPKYNEEPFIAAVKEYSEIWKNDGEKIVKAFEKVSGYSFQEEVIKAIVYEGISSSGLKGNDPKKLMMLRASHLHDTKKATLLHELGHRLLFGFEDYLEDYDPEEINCLILYDVWEEVYGKKFANKQVVLEKEYKGVYDYETTWNWVLGLGKERRKELFKRIKKEVLSKSS